MKQFLKENWSKTVLFFCLFFPSFVCATPAPTCIISISPNIINQGELTNEYFKIVGPVTKVIFKFDGILSYMGNELVEDYPEISPGREGGYKIKPGKIGTGSETIEVYGPGGTNSCSASIEVVANNLDDKNSEELTGILAVNGALRECPSKDCEIIRYYWETAEVKIIGIDDGNEWYKTITKDDYGNDLNGWMHYSLFTQDYRKIFLEVTLTSNEEKKSDQDKKIVIPNFFKNNDFRIGLIITFVFVILLIGAFLLRKNIRMISRALKGIVDLIKKKIRTFVRSCSVLFKKKNKDTSQSRLGKSILSKTKFKQKSFVVSLPIILMIIVGVAGISYGAYAYKNGSDAMKKAEQLISESNYQAAIVVLSGVPKSNILYYQKSQTKIEEAKRKIVEGQLSDEKIAHSEAEIKARQEEARANQEELEKNIKIQQLSEKEAEERRMKADNDRDGLTYAQEVTAGTSDLNSDSDGDGIKDGEDAHPAGGGRYLAQHFSWEYKGNPWSWDYSIQEDWYEYYKNKPRSPQGTEYVTPNDPFIKKIAEVLKETSDKENYHLTSFIVSFIQGLPYVEDYYTSFDEYPKYPIETFIEGNGDCEDTSYLFASLAQAAGKGTALVQFHNHMGVGINTVHSASGYYYPIGDEWYYYYETTAEGWQVGDLPKDYLYENAKVIRIWDGSVQYLSPQYIKPCYVSSDFPGYYFDGKNYYSDSQCNYLTYCMFYEEYYVNPHRTNKLYWDSACSQEVLSWCSKSIYYPGYFYSTISKDIYLDSQCVQKATFCRPSINYSDTYYDGYNEYWDSNCTQKVVSWCSKSTYHPGYFFSSLDYKYYYDSQCIQKADLK